MSTSSPSVLKDKYIFEPNRANLYYADVLVEISERLQIELDKSKLSLQELQRILEINDDYYLEGILECFEDVKVKDISNIFSVFGKFLSIVPLSQGEVARIHNVNKNIKKYSTPEKCSFTNDVFLICKKNESNYEDIAIIGEIKSSNSLTSNLSLPLINNSSKTISSFGNDTIIMDVELCHLK
ncbi:hypothetical protein [Aggregatibacter actinomycetemcomitans]|nr:hypothetical protein [Aggregatibacter actinomycetemcomitans]TYA48978.1 hypothetical protein FXB74_06905 [Aggregatibacter actinomycetemcomitans]